MEARVLIIEDEVLIAFHLEQLVGAAGHRVVGIALDPTEARTLARAQAPHFALVDMRLRRGTSGLEAARYLWEQHQVPSIFISGNLDAQTMDAAADLQPIAFVGKPFFPSKIAEALSLAVQRLSESSNRQ